MIRNLPRWLALSLVFIFIVGAVFTWWTVGEKDGQMRQQLLTETRLGATGIGIENVAALTGSEADLNSQDYHLLKVDLIQTRLANPGIRFVYLTGQRPDGKIFFFADSEPPESENYSPPGQVYTEVSDTFRQVFRTAGQTTEGPVSDRWGMWVSGFVPLLNPKTGTLVAVLGMDVDAKDWNRELIGAATVPVLVTGVIASILVLFFILQQRTQRENRRLAASEAALQKSEEKYRLIADNTADNIWIFDLDLNLKYISPSVKRMRGFTVEEAMVQTLEQMMTPKSHESLLKCFQEEMALEAGGTADPERTVSLETAEFCKDGSTILMESTIRFLRDLDHHPVGIIGISRDITERKRAEEALQIQHNLALALTTCHTMKEALKLTLDAALQDEGLDSGGIYVADPVTGALDIAVHRGLSPELIEHTSHFEADALQVLRAKTGTPFYGRYADIRPPGNDEIREREGVTALASIPVLHDGNLVAIMNMASHVHDDIPIHTRHLLEIMAAQIGGALAYIRSEEALYKSESHLSDIINFLPDAMFAVDENGTVIVWNEAIEKMTGVSAEQILGKGNYEYALPFYHERRPILVDLIRNNDPVTEKRYPNLQRIGNTLMAETFIPHFNNGKGAHIWVRASALYGQVGKSKGAIEIIRDITERKQAEDALRESEKKYHSLSTIMRLMCDNVPDMIWAKDLKKRFIFANKAICRDLLNAADTDEPIGKTDMFFAERERTRHADDPEWHTFGEICRDTDQITMDAGTPQQFDENGNVQGNYLFLDVRKAPFIDEHGKMIGTVGSARDVTVLKQREAALVESEEKFRMLLLHVPSVAVQGYSMDGTTTYWYDGAENLYGYTAEEAIGKNLIELIIPPEMREDVRKAITYMAKTGQPIPASELSLMRKDGSRVAVFSSHVIIKRSQGEMELYCLDIDLTERKRAEQTLIDAKNYLDLILNTIADPVFVKDGKHRRVLVNDAYCRFLGLPREELIKKSDHDLFPRDQADSLTREDNLVFASGTGQVTEEQVTDMGNQVHTMVTKKTLLVDGQGNRFIVGVARDITERKRTEVALREANRKLTLLSGITRHDINNQLMALMAFLALLEENQPDPTLNGYCRKATTTAQRISAMIRFTEEYEEIGVKAPTWQDCRTLVDTAAKQALPGKVMVKNDLPAGAEVFADPLVVKVFYNLMDNAARYGGKITTIRFSVRESGDDYLIVCEDDGEGIPDEEKEQIFERSFGKNTGLGLFLSREILTITHITIRETGKPGKGARFEITVPKGAYRIAGVQ